MAYPHHVEKTRGRHKSASPRVEAMGGMRGGEGQARGLRNGGGWAKTPKPFRGTQSPTAPRKPRNPSSDPLRTQTLTWLCTPTGERPHTLPSEGSLLALQEQLPTSLLGLPSLACPQSAVTVWMTHSQEARQKPQRKTPKSGGKNSNEGRKWGKSGAAARAKLDALRACSNMVCAAHPSRNQISIVERLSSSHCEERQGRELSAPGSDKQQWCFCSSFPPSS